MPTQVNSPKLALSLRKTRVLVPPLETAFGRSSREEEEVLT